MPDAASDAPLILLAEPAVAVTGRYTAIAQHGRRVLGEELAARLTRAGAEVLALPAAAAGGFRWGPWFAAAARAALRRHAQAAAVVGYATAGSLALVDDDAIAALLAPDRNAAVANNRFSTDAFAVRGDLDRALSVLEDAPSDNAAGQRLADAGYAVSDLANRPFATADVDTPHDLALVSRTRPFDGVAPPAIPRLDDIGRVVRDRRAELVVAGRVSSATARYLETETACRVRLFVEERGMRAGPREPRSLLAAWLSRHGAASLVEQLAALGDAVVLDTRVLMGAIGGSSDAAAWPPAEERFASDFLDASPVTTPWLRELTEAAADSSTPVMLGAHLLVNDGLRILVQQAWAAAEV
ncbi:MAG: hypothetical protein M3295_04955 [Chloroflexota bacterium]|nr:hypothetical protein [Chloroflexota bacterium]